jgi:hypothetical protein
MTSNGVGQGFIYDKNSRVHAHGTTMGTTHTTLMRHDHTSTFLPLYSSTCRCTVAPAVPLRNSI